ncbi:MAG: hypothetical protein GX855_10465 [Firmicutes bacterium]|nr:hypothetical protein [Bacillota bacterium]
MHTSEDILQKARLMLREEIGRLQQELQALKKRQEQLDKILGTPGPVAGRQSISRAIMEILETSPYPLSTREIVEKFQTTGIPQRAKNPYNSIQALLHHLKKSDPPRVVQDPVTRKWSPLPNAHPPQGD